MKKNLFKKVTIMFLSLVTFFVVETSSTVYHSDSGWIADGGKSSSKGLVTCDEPLLDGTGKEIGRTVCCIGSEWICWEIDGEYLYVDPVQPGPGGSPENIYNK